MPGQRIITTLVLGLVLLVSVSGCQLLQLPFQLLGSLFDQAVQYAPYILPLLAVQVPADAAPDVDTWIGDPAIPDSPVEAREQLARIRQATTPTGDEMDLVTVLARLDETARRTGTVPRVLVLDGQADPAASYAPGEGMRTYYIRVGVRVGEDGLAERQQVLARLKELGADVRDLTGVRSRPTLAPTY